MTKTSEKHGASVLPAVVAAAIGVAFLTTNAAAMACPSGMTSYWTFDEGAGITAHDSVGGNHGTLFNAPAWETGRSGGALGFDGVDDYVDAGPGMFADVTEAFTFEGWLKTDDTGTWRRIASRLGVLEFRMIGNGEFSLWTEGGSCYIGLAGPDIRDGQWHHFAFTYDGSVLKSYRDGSYVVTRTGCGGPLAANANDLYLGCWNPAPNQLIYVFLGSLDEVAVWNTALTPEEVQRHYDKGQEGLGYCAQTPVAVAEPGVDENDLVILDGSSSRAADGPIVSWDWVLTNRDPEGSDFTLAGERAATDSVDIGAYDVTLTVTDTDGLTGADAMVLAVGAAGGGRPEPNTAFNVSQMKIHWVGDNKITLQGEMPGLPAGSQDELLPSGTIVTIEIPAKAAPDQYTVGQAVVDFDTHRKLWDSTPR
ncbi:MAG: LamG-like jellyroll fold domain-containing protein [Elusimicrobiota bacterium]